MIRQSYVGGLIENLEKQMGIVSDLERVELTKGNSVAKYERNPM